MTRRHLVAFVLLVGGLPATLAGPDAAKAAPPGAEVALAGATQVSSGNDFTCARLSSGQARCWGRNHVGQLGDGNIGVDAHFPVAVRNPGDTGNLTGVAQISAGNRHACAVLTSGNVVCWGENEDGQLGDDSFDDSDVPSTVANAGASGPLTGVAEVSAGGTHTCARLAVGQARCWGNDLTGQLGNNNASGDGAVRPVTVVNAAGTGPITGIAQVEAGLGFSCARLTIGQARCWGGGTRLGDNGTSTSSRPVVVVGVSTATLTGVTQLSTGWQHSCARLNDGRAVCWGVGGEGRLGNGSPANTLRPVLVANAAGTGPITGVAELAAGITLTCARTTTSRAFCWGNNSTGGLGDGDLPNDSLLPVAVRNAADTAALASVAAVSAESQSCAVVAGGQLRCWGFNAFGQLGNGSVGNRDLPVVVRSS